MRSLTALTVAAVVLLGTALTSIISSHSTGVAVAQGRAMTLRTAAWLGPVAHGIGLSRTSYTPYRAGGDVVLQTTPVPTDTLTSTATATATASATPTATTTNTKSNLPDPSTLLSQMVAVLQVAKSVHFKEVAVQTGTVDLKITDTGDAACAGLGLKAHVTAHADVPGTTQVQNSTFDLIRIKNKDYWKDSKHTHGTWQPTTAKNVDPFGFVVMDPGVNPLGCFATLFNASSSGTGSGTQDQLTQLSTVAEMTFNKQDVYDVHAVDLQLNTSTNQTTSTPVDWYIGKAHPLLYGTLVTFDDPTQNAKGSVTQYFGKYGENFKATAPHKGSKTP